MHVWPCGLGQLRGEVKVGAEIQPTPTHVPELRAVLLEDMLRNPGVPLASLPSSQT